MTAPSALPRFRVLGVPVSAITMQDAVSTIDTWIRTRRRHYVCITGVHGVMECRRDPTLRAIHEAAGMVTPDGMPLVWMAHRLGFPHVSRVYGPDLMREISRVSPALGFRHFYFGGGPGLADRLATTLRERHPGLVVAGTFSPPFAPISEEEGDAIVRRINAAKPDIVWVGLSTPKQERWMSAHRDRIEAPVMIGVGAAFDFLAGTKRQAPIWMQRSGLEWLFRMLSEPKRLGRRYASIVPQFIALAAIDLARRDRRIDRPEGTV